MRVRRSPFAEPAGSRLTNLSEEAIDDSHDPRVTQFVHGEAGERLMEMRKMADLRSSNS